MTYVGELKNRLRDGHGAYAFPGGFFRYDGAWVKGKMHGGGAFVLGDGTTYKGNFEDGEMNGVGLKRWPDGSTYSGSFREGEMHGDGVFLSSTGERYDGQWSSNAREGAGELAFANKDVYRGSFRAHKPDGRGRIQYALTGMSYEGEWRAGLRAGQGVLCDRSGANVYEGEWSNDQRHGRGAGAIDVTATVSEAASSSPVALNYDGVWENDHPADRTTRIAAMLLSHQDDELVDLPRAGLTVANKQLPPIAVVCFGDRDASAGQPTRVIGESGRRIVLTIFEGHPPSWSSTTAGESAAVSPLASARDGEASPPPSQWQFVLEDPAVEAENFPRSEDAPEEAAPAENDIAALVDASSRATNKHRVDKVEGVCSAGKVVFRGLRLPAATLTGSYYLACESRTSDVLEAVHVPLMVVDEGVASSSGSNHAQGAKK